MSQQQLLLGVGGKADLPVWVMETGDTTPSGEEHETSSSRGQIAVNDSVIAWCHNYDYLSGKVPTEYDASGSNSLSSKWKVGTVTCADHNGNIKWNKELTYADDLPNRTNAADNDAHVYPIDISIDSSSNVYVVGQLYHGSSSIGQINQAYPMFIAKFNSSGSMVAKKLIGSSGVWSSWTYSGANNEIRQWGAQICCLANGKILVISQTKGAGSGAQGYKQFTLDYMVLDNDLTPGGDRVKYGVIVDTSNWLSSYSEFGMYPYGLKANGNVFSHMYDVTGNSYMNSWNKKNNAVVGSVNSSGQITFTRSYKGGEGSGNNPYISGVAATSNLSHTWLLRDYHGWDNAGPANLRHSMGVFKKTISSSWGVTGDGGNYNADSTALQKILFWDTGGNSTSNSYSSKLVNASTPYHKTKMIIDETNGHLYIMIRAGRSQQGTNGSSPAIAKLNASNGSLIWTRSIDSSNAHRDGTIGSRDGAYWDMDQSDDAIFVYGQLYENTDDEGWTNGYTNTAWKWYRQRTVICKFPKDGAGAASYTTMGVNSSDEYDNWVYHHDALPLAIHPTQNAWNDSFQPQAGVSSSYSWNTTTDGNWEDRVGTNYNDMFFSSSTPWQISDLEAHTSTKSVNVIALT